MLPPLQPATETAWTLPDGYVASGYLHHPPTQPRGLLIYLHGIQSHGGWYQHSASLLAQCGHLVAQPDRRGSGRNETDRGDVTSPAVWLNDVAAIIAACQEQFGPLPVAVVGVSWGGKLAAAYALQQPTPIAGSLLIAPGILPQVGLPLHERLKIAGSYATGGRTGFEIPLDDASLFTENPAGQRFIEDDPLRLTHATARFLIHSTRLDRRVRRAAPASLSGPDHQLLLASEDRIIDNPRTQAWAERVGMPCEVLAGRHTLEFAEDAEAFWQAVTKWGSKLFAE